MLGSDPPPPPCVTFRLVVAPLRGPGRSPVLPFACCVGALLSDPPPPPARQVGQPQPKPPSRHGDQGGGGGGVGQMGFRAIPPPQSKFLPALPRKGRTMVDVLDSPVSDREPGTGPSGRQERDGGLLGRPLEMGHVPLRFCGTQPPPSDCTWRKTEQQLTEPTEIASASHGFWGRGIIWLSGTALECLATEHKDEP